MRRFDPFELTPISMTWLSVITRLQGLHDAVGREIVAGNPHAVYPLLRSFTETVALLIYIIEHPTYVLALGTPRDQAHRASPRKLVDRAKTRMPGIDPIYRQLSQVAHFDTIAFALPFDSSAEHERRLKWQSEPKWKNDHDALVACGWLIELAEASHQLLGEYADRLLVLDDDEERRLLGIAEDE